MRLYGKYLMTQRPYHHWGNNSVHSTHSRHTRMACKTTVVNSFKRMIIYKIIRFSDWVMATQFSRYMWIIRRGVGADTRGGSPGLLRKGRKWRRIRFVCRPFLQDAIIHRKWRTTEARYPSVPLLLIKITLEITRNFYIIFKFMIFLP